MYQREKLRGLMAPLMLEISKVAPLATYEDLMSIGEKIIIAAPEITNCFNGAEQFKDPNQLEMPV